MNHLLTDITIKVIVTRGTLYGKGQRSLSHVKTQQKHQNNMVFMAWITRTMVNDGQYVDKLCSVSLSMLVEYTSLTVAYKLLVGYTFAASCWISLVIASSWWKLCCSLLAVSHGCSFGYSWLYSYCLKNAVLTMDWTQTMANSQRVQAPMWRHPGCGTTPHWWTNQSKRFTSQLFCWLSLLVQIHLFWIWSTSIINQPWSIIINPPLSNIHERQHRTTDLVNKLFTTHQYTTIPRVNPPRICHSTFHSHLQYAPWWQPARPDSLRSRVDGGSTSHDTANGTSGSIHCKYTNVHWIHLYITSMIIHDYICICSRKLRHHIDISTSTSVPWLQHLPHRPLSPTLSCSATEGRWKKGTPSEFGTKACQRGTRTAISNS